MSSSPSKADSIVVTDTGPLLALARIDRIPLLATLFDQCWVTQSVVDECLAKPEHMDAIRVQQALDQAILVCVPDPEPRKSLQALDAGERTAIELAIRQQCSALIDEKKGRKLAQEHGITIVGTVGVLLLAHHHGLLPDLGSTLLSLQKVYYLSDQLIRQAIELSKHSAQA